MTHSVVRYWTWTSKAQKSLRRRFSSSTRALADLTVREGLDHIALVSLATAFGSIEFVDEMVSTHSALDNDLTRTSGMPAGVAPWVFSRRLLERLSLLSGPGIPSHPALAYKRLRGGHEELPRNYWVTCGKRLSTLQFDMAQRLRRCLSP